MYSRIQLFLLVNIDGMNVFQEVYSHMDELPTYMYACTHICICVPKGVYVLSCVDTNNFKY